MNDDIFFQTWTVGPACARRLMDIPPLGQVTALAIGEQLVNIMIRLSILSKETGLTAKAVIDKYAEDPSTDE